MPWATISLCLSSFIDLRSSLAAIGKNIKVGLYRNNIPKFIKKQKNKKFSEWQKKPKASDVI